MAPASISVDVAILTPSAGDAGELAALLATPAFADPSNASALLDVAVEEPPVVEGITTVVVQPDGAFEVLLEPTPGGTPLDARLLYIGGAATAAVLVVLVGGCWLMRRRCRQPPGRSTAAGVPVRHKMVLRDHPTTHIGGAMAPSGSPLVRKGGSHAATAAFMYIPKGSSTQSAARGAAPARASPRGQHANFARRGEVVGTSI